MKKKILLFFAGVCLLCACSGGGDGGAAALPAVGNELTQEEAAPSAAAQVEVMTAAAQEETAEETAKETAKAAGDSGEAESETGEAAREVPQGSSSAKPAPSKKIELTQDIIEGALIRQGNTARLAAVMQRAAAGEEITLAYIGGSITAGSLANPMQTACYAYLTTQWWERSFPAAKFNYVNAGIGATDSWVGVHRVRDEVLLARPDVVVVEFSVNDYQAVNTESYESLVRRILMSETEPAVIPLMLATKGSTYAPQHAVTALHYDLPIIAYYNLLDSGLVAWDDVGNADGVHPNNTGHALIADLLGTYYQSVLDGASDTGYTLPEQPHSACRYLNASFYYADGSIPVLSDGFLVNTKGYVLNGASWETKSAGSFAFECDARTIGIAWKQYNKAPAEGAAVYEVYVDDVHRATIHALNEASWGDSLSYTEIFKDSEIVHHSVRLVPADDNQGQCFVISALAIGE